MLTSATSIRIPFSLPLYVGGIKLNMAKFTVAPAALAPSTVTVKLFDASFADALGLSVVNTCVQFVCEPESVTLAAAKMVPEAVCSARVASRSPSREAGNL